MVYHSTLPIEQNQMQIQDTTFYWFNKTTFLFFLSIESWLQFMQSKWLLQYSSTSSYIKRIFGTEKHLSKSHSREWVPNSIIIIIIKSRLQHPEYYYGADHEFNNMTIVQSPSFTNDLILIYFGIWLANNKWQRC